jgi:hypothetical protein
VQSPILENYARFKIYPTITYTYTYTSIYTKDLNIKTTIVTYNIKLKERSEEWRV